MQVNLCVTERCADFSPVRMVWQLPEYVLDMHFTIAPELIQSFAQAVLHQLATHSLPLSFFATHYGSLTDDFAYHPNIRNMHMATLVDDDRREVRIVCIGLKVKEPNGSGIAARVLIQTRRRCCIFVLWYPRCQLGWGPHGCCEASRNRFAGLCSSIQRKTRGQAEKISDVQVTPGRTSRLRLHISTGYRQIDDA